MNKKKLKNEDRGNIDNKITRKKSCGSISYHLKCAKTANGLSHFVMYGDVPDKKALL